MKRRAVVPAHDQVLTIRLVEHVPAHTPRGFGPAGLAFRRAKRRAKRLGLDTCSVLDCDTGAKVEWHHDKVETAWQRGVSIRKFNRLYGLHLTPEEFTLFVQGPGNLTPLCSVHHRTQLGIHVLPVPIWNALLVWTNDRNPPPAEHLTKGKP